MDTGTWQRETDKKLSTYIKWKFIVVLNQAAKQIPASKSFLLTANSLGFKTTPELYFTDFLHFEFFCVKLSR